MSLLATKCHKAMCTAGLGEMTPYELAHLLGNSSCRQDKKNKWVGFLAMMSVWPWCYTRYGNGKAGLSPPSAPPAAMDGYQALPCYIKGGHSIGLDILPPLFQPSPFITDGQIT